MQPIFRRPMGLAYEVQAQGLRQPKHRLAICNEPLVHICLNNSAPPYLADKIRPLSDDCNRSRLRSSNSSDVFVPRKKTKMGDRVFDVAGPRTLNSLLQLFVKPKPFLL